MKEISKKFYGFLVAAVVLCVQNIYATGYPVFDISGWLAAIDQIYQAYDMVENTITQIEQQYEAIQKQVERAKSIDWDNIKFDGDFDIRNDIRDANKRVNKLLTSARNIRNLCTTPSISIGDAKYSISDLCGTSDSDRNLWTAATEYGNYMSSSMKTAMKNIVEDMSDADKKKIYAKYGISPQNYVFAQQTAEMLKKQISNRITEASEEAEQMKFEERISQRNSIIEAAYETLDQDGNMSEGAAAQAQIHMLDALCSQMDELNRSIDEGIAQTSYKMLQEQQMAEQKADEQAQRNEEDYYRGQTVSSRYKRN
jgi:hypothetical protein